MVDTEGEAGEECLQGFGAAQWDDFVPAAGAVCRVADGRLGDACPGRPKRHEARVNMAQLRSVDSSRQQLPKRSLDHCHGGVILA